MPSKASRVLLILCLTVRGVGLADESMPFALPVPDNWRTETILFPLEFAPELPYTGLEELRFAPGMFEKGADDFWTYAFVWWVHPDGPTDTQALASHLETYFRGLTAAVAASRSIDASQAAFGTHLAAGPEASFSGWAETLDAFVTGNQLRLYIEGQIIGCEEQGRLAIFFALSPRETDHPVWTELRSIQAGFHCEAP